MTEVRPVWVSGASLRARSGASLEAKPKARSGVRPVRGQSGCQIRDQTVAQSVGQSGGQIGCQAREQSGGQVFGQAKGQAGGQSGEQFMGSLAARSGTQRSLLRVVFILTVNSELVQSGKNSKPSSDL